MHNGAKNNSTISHILVIGADLTSNGGIASVVKSHYQAHKRNNRSLQLILLKTNFYKDKSLFFEVMILVKAVISFLIYTLSGKVDLVHIHTSAKRSFLRKSIFVFLALISRRKIILHLHSSDFYGFFLSENPILRRYIKTVLRRADRVIVLCSDWERKLKSAYKLKNVVRIANPTTLDREEVLSAENHEGRFILCFVGFLIESKGLSDLIQAMTILKSRGYSDVLLNIAGKGELKSKLSQQIQDNHLADNVKLIGWVSGKAKSKLYLNSDAFILPSYKEGMPISILEAMSFGLPVISTEISGIPDVVSQGRNGFLVQPGDVNAIVDAIVTCREDARLRNTIKQNNLIDITKYSADHIFEEVSNVYDEILN